MNKRFALITGASEGFGKSLAFECASRNFNLVLVALPGSGLQNVASFIEKNFKVLVFFFEHDLSKREECYKLFHEIQQSGILINILINNAGLGGTHYFTDRTPEYYYKQIELNVVTPTLLIYYFLENMERCTPSYILNVGSLASHFSVAKKGVYSGTKSYLLSFSRSLGRELKRKRISVSTVCPGAMNTTPILTIQNRKLTGLGRWSVMNPEDVARITIDSLLAKRELIIPGFWNKLFLLLNKILPKWYKELLTDRGFKQAIPQNQGGVKQIVYPLKPAI